MAFWQNQREERKSLEEYFSLLEQEYLLINTDIRVIEVFRREKNDLWLLYTLQYEDTVNLQHLDIRFPVADVYQNTSLQPEIVEDK